ncbi:MAG: hypothetical protein F4125_03905 [Acidimicrobiaceae bacterium]|nr:hypothetical protein [Acidimicrobiaceae bacterium]
MRAGTAQRSLPTAAAGSVWSYEESDIRAHEFLAAVAGNRDIYEYVEDPVEHARVNSLMLLFNEEVAEAFETFLARMPQPRAEAWRELISGGVSSEVFGPLTLQERVDEHQIGAYLQATRNRRIISAVVTAVVAVALVLVGVVVWNELIAEDDRIAGSLDFGVLGGASNEAALVGGPPVVETSLIATLSETVAVLAGDAPLAQRDMDAPPGSFPYPAGSVSATLFQYAGSGHVLFVGPSGFVDDSCLRASVVTQDLRPLDVVTSGPCVEPVGRTATVGCVGPTAVLLDLKVPTGVVELPEGGSGFADAVRVKLVGHDERFEALFVGATIEVSAGDEDVVPRFGAAPGDELIFNFGTDQVGVCTVTGALPQ